MVLLVLCGVSLCEVTLMVIVLADGSVSTPLLAVPPLSWTWKVKIGRASCRERVESVDVGLPLIMTAAETNWPAVTATLSTVREPGPGMVVIVNSRTHIGG